MILTRSDARVSIRALTSLWSDEPYRVLATPSNKGDMDLAVQGLPSSPRWLTLVPGGGKRDQLPDWKSKRHIVSFETIRYRREPLPIRLWTVEIKSKGVLNSGPLRRQSPGQEMGSIP